MLSLYIHIPFCLKKCGYCDFHSVAFAQDKVPQERYVEALCSEADIQAERFGLKGKDVGTIYLGGGTPTMIEPKNLETLLKHLAGLFKWSPNVEISIEANPETLTRLRTDALTHLFNRISIGIQTFDDARLRHLGRIHNSATAKKAVETTRAAGFKNISIDLMWGFKGQKITDLKNDLEEAIKLSPQHISAYQLTLEHDAEKYQVTDDLAAEMFMTVHDTLMTNGYEHYEISNFAQKGFHCRHNENYWRYGDWLGLGSGATSQLGKQRFTAFENIPEYLNKKFNYDTEDIDSETAFKESCFLGLRTTDGIDLESFNKRYPGLADEWINRGLALTHLRTHAITHSLSLTLNGWLISDTLFSTLA